MAHHSTVRRRSRAFHIALSGAFVALGSGAGACSGSDQSSAGANVDASASGAAPPALGEGGGGGATKPGGGASHGVLDGSTASAGGSSTSKGGTTNAGGGRGVLDATTGPVVADASVADAASDANGTAPGGGTTCARFVTDTGLAKKRDACAFTAGAKVQDTVENSAAARAAIKHLIVLTHENRSMDHMYGTIGHGIEGFPASYTNPDASGKAVRPSHLTTACPPDISHSVASITAEWDDGKMDGFVKTDGLGAFGYYEPGDHPFYSLLVTTFSVADRNFCSTLGATGENRRFLYGASANANGTKNIITEMNAAKVTWADYFVGTSPIYNTFSLPADFPGAHPYADFLPALDAGDLPSVVFLDTPSDEHPPGSMKAGEGIVYDVVSHAVASPIWKDLAIVFNYDEGGGFFDHVAPPAACKPSSVAADAAYTVEGIRVPLVVISPFARKGYVSHVHHSHTSVLRLIELLHDLPALTARDANSDALLDMFDFDCPPFLTPPPLGPRPPGGC